MAERRKRKRFELRLPIELVRAGSARVKKFGEVHNVGPAGVLFESPIALEIGQVVEYLITLPAKQERGIRLHCWGRVLRQQPTPEAPNTFAASLERYDFVRE